MHFSANTTTHKPREIETTEWEDVLVRKGIIEEREELKLQRQAKEEARNRTEVEVDAEDELLAKTLEELDEAEDDFEEATLERIRAMRLAELKSRAARERFGHVYPLAKADFVRDVAEASKSYWVVVEMFKDGIQESTKASELLRLVAARQKAVKFVRIRSTDCVEGWPDNSVPCLFLYHEGKMQKQLIGLDFCGGAELATAGSLELALAMFGLFSDPVEQGANGAFTDADADLRAERREEAELLERDNTTSASKSSGVSKVAPRGKLTPTGAVLDSLDDDDEDDDW